MATFDLYDGSNAKVLSGQASPLKLTDLEPNTTYTGYKVAYAGKSDMTTVPDFKTAAMLMTSFDLDKTEIAGKVGDIVKVTLSNVTPANTTNKVVNVGTTDHNIATAVDNGDGTYNVTLVAEGSTAAHWVAADGNGAKKDLNVTVSAAE